MVICQERGADLHMAQLMPLPLTVSCFSNIQIGFTFLVPAHPGSPGQRAVKRVCVCDIQLLKITKFLIRTLMGTALQAGNVYTVQLKDGCDTMSAILANGTRKTVLVPNQ